MTTDIKELLNKVTDLDLARKLETAIEEVLTKLKEEENRRKSSLNNLITCIDTGRELLKEEQKVQDKLYIEREQAEYDRDYYRNEVEWLRKRS